MSFFGHFDADSESVEVVWQIHAGVELSGGHFPLASGPTSAAIRTRQPQLIRHWSRSGPSVHLQYATDRPSLPESSIVVPVLYDDEVRGVLSIQSYTPAAYDEDDVELLTAVADEIAAAIFRDTDSLSSAPDAETVLASMDDALLVLDSEWRVVRLNQAARQLFCAYEGGLILGQPIDRAQADCWPLGSEALSEQLQAVRHRLEHGQARVADVELRVGADVVRCRASVLRTGGAEAGAVLVLRRHA
jgi:PAS domain-containing protein